MPVGKLHPDLLTKYVFKRIGVVDPRVVVGPAYGEDAAVIDIGKQYLVVHTDPITAAEELIGWLAVNVACNDVAVTGAKPQWLSITILLPEKSSEEVLDVITSQIDRAAKELGVMVIGGHTEYTPGIDKPIVIATAIGLTPRKRFVKTSNAKPGDYILMTKTAGLEGTAIIATDFEDKLLSLGLSRDLIENAKKFFYRISVVKEALLLYEIEVNAMHDPTEGGILGGLAEIAYSSNVLIEVYEENIPIAPETLEICRVLNLDPLKLISSGVLLASIPQKNVDKALRILRDNGIDAKVIGRVREGCGVLLHRKDGRVEKIPKFVEEEIYRLWI